jgi:multiple sugar transport system ATP-binding protein
LGTTTIYVTHDQEEAMTLGDRVCVMCDGEKRQCAPPLEVYQKPADRFVAGFLGMPPMNFLEGELEQANGHIWFVSRDAHLRLDNADEAWLGDATRRTVVAGIRPESLQISETGEDHHCIPATVQVVEPLGSMMDVYLALPSGKRLVSRVPAGKLSEGKVISLKVNPAEVHLFELPSADDRYGRSLRSAEVQLV